MSWRAALETSTTYRLNQHRHRPDYRLVVAMALLVLTGLVVIYAISPALSYRLLERYQEQHFLYRQLLHIALGIGAFLAASIVPLPTWQRLTKPLVYVALGANALLLVPGLGITVNGATRWLNIGPISSFQPAELLKLALIFVLADRLARLRDSDLSDHRQTVSPALWLLGALGVMVVIFQRDLGTMLVITALVLGMLYIGGVAYKALARLVGAVGLAGLLAVVLFPHRLERLLTFLRPDGDVQGAGYHISQSLIAVGSGGLLGLGLGRSLQVYGYLPEAANDSIFAIFAEKFGFIGCLLLLGLFAFLLQRILSVAQRAPDTYTQLLVGGVFIWVATHVFINIGAMLALLPLTGITLPFLSIGGSSLIIIMFAMGLVFQVSRYSHYRVEGPVLSPLGQRIRS